MTESDVKEVQMITKEDTKRRKRKTRKAAADDATVVTKDATVVARTAEARLPAPSSAPAPAPAPIVVLAPPKKKPAKIMLVPKGKPVVRPVGRKTFRARRVRLVVDNTRATQNRRKSVVAKVDALTDDQIRAAAVHARLSRRDTVGNAPIALLRQMILDYQAMKGALL